VLSATSGTASSSTETGAVVVTGGIGVSGAAFIGGVGNVAGVLTAANTTESTSTGTGGLVCSGGIGVAKAVRVGSTTASTSSTTGALIVSGGGGFAKDCTVNGASVGIGAGTNNTRLGVSAQSQMAAGGEACTAMGFQAGFWNSTGDGNSAFGFNSLLNTRAGSWNTGFGINALLTNQTGSHNVACGLEALYSVTSEGNTGIGSNAGYNFAAVSDTVVIGYLAGKFHSNGSTALTSGSSSVYLGAKCRGLNDSDSNTVVIGANAIADGANSTVIGTTSTTQARLRGATLLSTGANGQSTSFAQATALVSTPSGSTVTSTNLIPANSIVLGVTVRVTTAVTGATTFDVGDGTTANRFADDVAVALNTTSQLAIAPALFAAATNVVLTANGSNFTGGAVRVTVHYITLVAPTS